MKAVAAFLAASALAAAAGAEPPTQDLRIRIDPQTRSFAGETVIRLDSRRAVTIVLSSRFRVNSMRVDGRRIRPATAATATQRFALPAARRIQVRWSGELASLDTTLGHRDTLSYNLPTAGHEGTFFPAGAFWYPAIEGEFARYRVALDLPSGQKGLVPGRLVEESDTQNGYRARFEMAAPTEPIALMAGPYQIEERRLRTAAGTAVRLRAYFHAQIANLARSYLDAVAGYLDLYERWIGAYPFSEFSIVSSPTPTGFGMPTLTYLGVDVLRLPFIVATSLGHEVLHNWWGNGVYPEYESGNWSEGLTTFMADYAYAEQKGGEEARAMRLAWLRDFAALPPGKDTPLARFTERGDGASQIVGYHKAAMLFFMLRDAIGAAAFDEGLRRFWKEYRFRTASWDDLRGAFERASGRALSAFFEQWLARPGAPQLRIVGAKAAREGGVWRTRITLAQQAPAYAVSVPLRIRLAGEETERRVELSRESETFVIDSQREPLSVALDPELRVFRRLLPGEAPPILRETMLASGVELMILSTGEDFARAATALSGRLLERAPRRVSPEERAAGAARLVVGLHTDVDAWLARAQLPARPASLAAARGSAQVWTRRSGEIALLTVVSARDATSLATLAGPLPHYGQQSFLIFEGARVIERGVWPGKPQVWEIAAPPGGNWGQSKFSDRFPRSVEVSAKSCPDLIC